MYQECRRAKRPVRPRRATPAALAGAGLTAFSSGLLGLYVRTPGMRKKGSPFPTQQGITLAKDVWLVGIGLGLILDGLTDQ